MMRPPHPSHPKANLTTVNHALGIRQLGAVLGFIAQVLGVGQGLAAAPDPGQRLDYANRGDAQRIEDKGVQAEFNWKTPMGATLTSITALREWTTTNGQDIDYTTLDLLYRLPNGGYDRKFDQFSQELRLAGDTDKAHWLIGGFYANERLLQRVSLTYGKDFETYASLLFSSGTTLSWSASSCSASAGSLILPTEITGTEKPLLLIYALMPAARWTWGRGGEETPGMQRSPEYPV